MATFFNNATLSYNGITTTSNTVQGELVQVLSVTKTPVNESYRPGDTITYVVSITNSGTAAFSGLTITDDLGSYPFGTGDSRVPLTYVDGSLLYYVNGVLQATPVSAGGPPLTISGITIPAGGNVTLIYDATVNQYADPTVEGTITNTVSVDGTGLSETLTDSATVSAGNRANLTITKSLNPTTVAENGQLTYTFQIQNTGNLPAAADDTVVLTDVFDPRLENITVTFNGQTWSSPANYTYDAATGVFTTVSGQITVPAATYTQDDTGNYILVPGVSTLVVTGTV